GYTYRLCSPTRLSSDLSPRPRQQPGQQAPLRAAADLLGARPDLREHVVGREHPGHRGAFHEAGEESGVDVVARHPHAAPLAGDGDRKSTRLKYSHVKVS